MQIPADWWLELGWTDSRTLDPVLFALFADLPVDDDDVRVDLDRGRAYAWLDAAVAAEAQDKASPSTFDALLPGQLQALLTLHAHGDAIQQEATRQSAAMWRAKGQISRPETLTLLGVHVTDRCAEGLAYTVLQFSSVLHVEHGLQALVLGDQVQRVAHEIAPDSIPGKAPAPVSPRLAETLPEFLREPTGGPSLDGLLDELISLGLKPKPTAEAPPEPKPPRQDPFAALLGAALAEPAPEAPEPEAPEPVGTLPEGLLTIWEEREWIELTPDADRARVRAALESLVEELPASKVADAVCELEGVEELYASDDELEEFLDLW